MHGFWSSQGCAYIDRDAPVDVAAVGRAGVLIVTAYARAEAAPRTTDVVLGAGVLVIAGRRVGAKTQLPSTQLSSVQGFWSSQLRVSPGTQAP